MTQEPKKLKSPPLASEERSAAGPKSRSSYNRDFEIPGRDGSENVA